MTATAAETFDREYQALMDELAESPLPGARYAWEVVGRRGPRIKLATLDAARSATPSSEAVPAEDGLREAIEDAITLLEAAPAHNWSPGEPDETIAALRAALASTERAPTKMPGEAFPLAHTAEDFHAAYELPETTPDLRHWSVLRDDETVTILGDLAREIAAALPIRASTERPAGETTDDHRVRYYLWQHCPHGGKYGDDGEMQCRGFDFRRSSVAECLAHLDAVPLADWRAARSSGDLDVEARRYIALHEPDGECNGKCSAWARLLAARLASEGWSLVHDGTTEPR